MSYLLPCPFCGGTDVNLRQHLATNMSWVYCGECGLEAPSETGWTDDIAIEYWNSRAPSPQPNVEAYRLLSEGEIVQHGDQSLNDDCVSWGELVGWEAGIAYYPSVYVPIRRLVTTEGSDNG